jgi:two-component system sensor histidine kinase DesK
MGRTGLTGTGLTGTGLTGLRERLSALGGELGAGVEPAGRYIVEARLPLTGMVTPMSADRSSDPGSDPGVDRPADRSAG